MAAAAQIKRLRLGGVRLQLSSQFRQLKSASSKLVTTNRKKDAQALNPLRDNLVISQLIHMTDF